MFKRLFGETEAQQFQYLKVRVPLTLLSIVLLVFGDIGGIFAGIMLFVWGWGAVKALCGIATIGAIFSGNVVFGVVIFVFYVIVAYLSGVFCALLGVGRYIYLLVKGAKKD